MEEMQLGHGMVTASGQCEQYLFIRLAAVEQKEVYRESNVPMCSDLQLNDSH
jgi:hypothetical protein